MSIASDPVSIVASTEVGTLGVLHLKRYWDKDRLRRAGQLASGALRREWNLDTTLLSVVGLGLEQALTHLRQMQPSFEDFEDWIASLHPAGLPREKVDAFNACILDRAGSHPRPDPADRVLDDEAMAFWNEHGYVIVRQAVSREGCARAIDAICEFIGIDRDDPATWYQPHPARQGIMVQLFQHPALEINRQSARIRAAFQQLWDRTDLWLNTDRAGFNPPETSRWRFPGPHLHWDVSLAQPIPFGLQGILYLADTEPDQGAFTLVPGFQHRVAAWLQSLPAGTDPRKQDLHAQGATPIAAQAGDFIIWHHALPHGSSPNTSTRPRFVQYINHTPLDTEERGEWI